MKANTKIPYAVPFHHNNPRMIVQVAKWDRPGDWSLNLAPCGGFLHSLLLVTPGGVRHVTLRDTNGAPMVSASPRALALITNDSHRIPIALTEDGLGAQADMNDACRYHLDLSSATEAGTVLADYWPLRTPHDLHGTPQAQVPPFHGMMATLSELFTVAEYEDGEHGEHLGFTMHRTGNKLAFLAFIPEPTTVAKATLLWDVQEYTIATQGMMPLVFVNTTNPDHMLPTLQATRIKMVRMTPEVHEGRWVVRDVFPQEVPAWPGTGREIPRR